MWSGGRSLRLISIAGLAGALGIAHGQTPLCNGQHPGNPELISGAASCFYNEVGGGQTVIQLGAGSVIRWDSFVLNHPESSLSFQWNGPADGSASVLNRVEQAGRAEGFWGGTLKFPDGNLIVTHPNTGLNITGLVEARSLTIAMHRLDPQAELEVLEGRRADFVDGRKALKVLGGTVVASGGDLVLAGQTVANLGGLGGDGNGSGVFAPLGAIRIFGGENSRLLPQNEPAGESRVQRLPGNQGGNVINSRTMRAERMVEIVAEEDIKNSGVLQADGLGGMVMMRVDTNGTITNEEGGLISADIIAPFPPPGPGAVLFPDRGDSPSALSTGLSRIPVVASPGQERSSKRVVLRESATVTGSASAQRQRANRSRGGTASTPSGGGGSATRGSGHLARGLSFFRARGGTKAKKK